MVLYAADVSKIAKPVKSMPRKKVKEEAIETNQVEEELKPKKKATKKQLENLAKGQAKLAEKRTLEKQEPKKRKADPEPESVEEEKPKRVRKKKEMTPEPTEQVKPKKKKEVTPEPIQEEKPKRVRKKKEIEPEESEELDKVKPKRIRVKKLEEPRLDVPPTWFNKYIESVKREEAIHREAKVPVKQVKQEAQEQATKSWNDGLTRDRVANEVDNHLTRMYSQIFAKS
jgi:hypothetical protein